MEVAAADRVLQELRGIVPSSAGKLDGAAFEKVREAL
jgi:hypothetical protein